MYLVVLVSGWYFFYLFVKYFGFGKIIKDQVKDYVK